MNGNGNHMLDTIGFLQFVHLLGSQGAVETHLTGEILDENILSHLERQRTFPAVGFIDIFARGKSAHGGNHAQQEGEKSFQYHNPCTFRFRN